MSSKDMDKLTLTSDDFYDDDETCWECGGEGGWNSCMEDTCCAIGGEEGCDDPLCWRRCPTCKGSGVLAHIRGAG